jgi:glycosyltransferase involved in cell wall biosynthesis
VLNNYPGWLAELITEKGCGYAVAPDDPSAFADAMVHAADHRHELGAMGTRALELAKTQFDRALLARDFVAWLEMAGNAPQALRQT